MNPAEQAWKAAVRPAAVLKDVERRLVAAGAITELRQLQGLSAQEQDVLVWLEIHEPTTSFPQRCASSDPQAGRDGVAA